MKRIQSGTGLDSNTVGENIRAMRRRAHLSQGEFALRLGMRQGPVCNIEQGKNLPSAQVLIKMAKVLNVTIDSLLRPEPYTDTVTQVQLTDVPVFSASDDKSSPPTVRNTGSPALYLTSTAIKLTSTDAFYTKVETVIRDYLALEDICRAPRHARIPLQMAFDLIPSGIERLASQLRTLLGIDSAVVFDLLELFENHGLRVVFMRLPEAVSGLSFYDAKNSNVFILIQSSITTEKQIFALAVEMGRILLYNRATQLGENPFAHEVAQHKNARFFAACFLMPEVVVRNSVSQIGVHPDEWDLELLLRLKHRFGVSAEAFNYRLLELGLITGKRQGELRKVIQAHYAAHAFAEPGSSRRILSPNGRLGDLLHTALIRQHPEAAAIAACLRKIRIQV